MRCKADETNKYERESRKKDCTYPSLFLHKKYLKDYLQRVISYSGNFFLKLPIAGNLKKSFSVLVERLSS